jgi:hypothetical protein
MENLKTTSHECKMPVINGTDKRNTFSLKTPKHQTFAGASRAIMMFDLQDSPGPNSFAKHSTTGVC